MTIDDLRREQALPVVLANEHSLITYVNRQFEEIFGWRADEVVGQPLSVIIPRNLHDAHNLGFSRFLTTGIPTLLNQPLALRAVARDGRQFDAEHIIVAEQHEGRWSFGATIRPLNG